MIHALLIVVMILMGPSLVLADPEGHGDEAHKMNPPFVLVNRQLYYSSPGRGVASWLSVWYAGAGLTRVENLRTSAQSDAYRNWQRRQSEDNGRTWSPPQPLDGVVQETKAGGIVEYPSHPIYDPVTKRSYRFFMVRQWPGLPCYTYDSKHAWVDHVFVSEDGGPPRLLRYEDGADLSPANPFDPAYLHANKAYFGNAPAFAPDGTVYFPVATRAGVILFRRDQASGEWRPSNGCPISPDLSSRGLIEPEAAVLRNGRILIVCRGSNTRKTPGRKWRILSEDGGKSLGPVEEFRYDDGSPFYSPSSIHRFLRAGRNGKLYWFANITPEPPRGNAPRYPLCIAEIDEERAAVRKDSLKVLDTRRAGEPETLQFSNFSLLEDRATGNIEIYVTLLGLNPKDFWRSDVYRYIFSP
ncbi:MAG: exo-alpha-sialidase [Lentisphaerae bacterium]|nr:exo-alpha-sialidase [Lentisphaerota bacterium]